jgi:hypothetical protein
VKPSSIISPSKDYFELLSDILSMDLRKIFILALNPLAKLSRNLEELLQAAKEIER